jgi:hypothetical protein
LAIPNAKQIWRIRQEEIAFLGTNGNLWCSSVGL